MALQTMVSGDEESVGVGDAGTQLPTIEIPLTGEPGTEETGARRESAGIIAGRNAHQRQNETLAGLSVAGVVTTVRKEEAGRMGWITGTRMGGR